MDHIVSCSVLLTFFLEGGGGGERVFKEMGKGKNME